MNPMKDSKFVKRRAIHYTDPATGAHVVEALPPQDAPTINNRSWRCFHCDEVFVSVKDAERHFGKYEGMKPLCVEVMGATGSALDLFRSAQNEVHEVTMALHAESVEGMKAYRHLQSRFHQATIVAEEAGYEKGLRDGRAEAWKPPSDCDGKEQDAFEAWAIAYGCNMETHPLHWLFLDSSTYLARQAWKGAIAYVNEEFKNNQKVEE